MDLPDHNQLPLGAWIGHILSFFAIGGAFFGLIPAFAALLAVFWYILEIYESKTMQRWIRARRLRKLVKLRIRAVALELLIREHDGELQALDAANQVNMAATGKAAELTHEAMVSEQRQAEGKRIEDALFGLKSSQQGSPEDHD